MSGTITRTELAEAIAAKGVVVLEALPTTYFEAEHLPGALNVPLDDLDELAPVLVPDKSAAVVTYCSNTSCNNSAMAAERLRAMGYTDVRAYEGGKQDWIEAGLPVESSGTVGQAGER